MSDYDLRFSSDPPLTPAAEATLREYLAEERRRIIDEAERLSPGETLSASEIVNAYEALQARSRSGVALSGWASSLRSDEASATFRPLLVGLLFAVSIVPVIIIALSTQGGEPNANDLRLLAIMLGGVFALGASGLVTLRYLDRRTERRARQVRELNAAIRVASPEMDFAGVEVSGEYDNESYVLARTFLDLWERLELLMRRLAEDNVGLAPSVAQDYPIGPLLNMLSASRVLPSGLRTGIHAALRIRNDISYGRRVNPKELLAGVQSARELEDALQHLIRNRRLHDV